ncbi:putative ribonuclease H protein At1g65750 isoform X2 [Beta vulgaris subsp. vulgaris]|uniref:putative ribonuclease H protein At1g65750 isoform X2 n=1 Tax=Beta vulgaris subsp. vulgaris TaxID=3555 RepID=UPI00203682CE|nr:putative ribonuclease H protein At1g65750 isoform X2 [Beta vulgaris subsp. vulgaris]
MPACPLSRSLPYKRGLDELRSTKDGSIYRILTKWPIQMMYKANFTACSECQKSGGRCGSSEELSSDQFVCYCSDGSKQLVCRSARSKSDDSLLFSRASRQECTIIVDILNHYELASGQKINYDKSEVSFSRGVSIEQREELKNILNMRQVDRHEKYLGIPSISGRSKKAVFDSLMDRIWKKLQGWKEKLLSRAGKEVLLKSVIQAIPTYLMGVYKLPISVIQKIHSAMARFWWGSSNTQRKIHWKSWESLCTLKCLGGMGFKDLRVFNDALLGRQAWRLVREPNALFARVMKAKYYSKCDFLDAPLGCSSSYSWSSIWSSKALLKEGVVWRVGNGTCIKIWDDPWVVDESGRYIASERNDAYNTVNELIDFDSMEWRVEVLETLFVERDVRCILSTPLSLLPMKDELTWAFTKDGCYSVKTAYMLGKGGKLDNFHQAWVFIWSMEVSPKVRHFLWRLCTMTLPVRALLRHRHMIEDDSCPLGCGAAETPGHAIYGCPHVRDIWTGSGCAGIWQDEEDNTFLDIILCWRDMDPKLVTKGAYLAWIVWSARNDWVFNQKSTPHNILIQRAHHLTEEFSSYAAKIYSVRAAVPAASPKTWVAPPLGVIKLNVDASLAVDGWVGLSTVARTSSGGVLFAATRRVRAHWTAAIAEAKAIDMALRLGKRFGLQDIVVESDCQDVIHRLSQHAIFLADLDVVLSNILASCVCFNSVVWSHVKRDGNFVAHHLARINPFGIEQIWENHYPPEVAPYVLMDVLSLNL